MSGGGPGDFQALLRWADTYWCPTGDEICDCGKATRGPRHHDIRCPYFGWAWEQKARSLLRGDGPEDDPATHLRP